MGQLKRNLSLRLLTTRATVYEVVALALTMALVLVLLLAFGFDLMDVYDVHTSTCPYNDAPPYTPTHHPNLDLDHSTHFAFMAQAPVRSDRFKVAGCRLRSPSLPLLLMPFVDAL